MRICRKLSYELKELYESMLSPEERERLPPMFSHPHALIPFLQVILCQCARGMIGVTLPILFEEKYYVF